MHSIVLFLWGIGKHQEVFSQANSCRWMPQVASTGEKVTLRLVAQYATLSNTFGDPSTVAHKMQVLDQWCSKVGRNPQEIERSISLPRNVSISQLDAYV